MSVPGPPERRDSPPPFPAPLQASPGTGVQTGPSNRSGLLLAGGIVTVITTVLVGLMGLAILFVGTVIDSFEDGLGGAIRVFGLLTLGFAGFGLVAGIGAILRLTWGKVCAIIFGGVNLAVAIPTVFVDRGDQGAPILYLALSASIVVLCSLGSARR